MEVSATNICAFCIFNLLQTYDYRIQTPDTKKNTGKRSKKYIRTYVQLQILAINYIGNDISFYFTVIVFSDHD